MTAAGGEGRGPGAAWRARVAGGDPIAEALLATGYGLLLFALLVVLHRRPGIDEAAELRIFVEGWTLVPVLAFAAGLLAGGVARRRPDPPDVLWRLAASNAALLLAGVLLLRGPAAAPGASLAWTLGGVLASGLLALRPGLLGWLPAAPLPALTVGLWTLLLVAATRLPLAWPAPAALGVVGLAALAAARAERRRWRPARPALFDAAVIVGLGLLVVDPGLPFEPFHHNALLGPTHAVLEGRTPLVDTHSAYGVLSIEFLAGVFGSGLLPFSYVGLALLATLLLLLRFVGVYALLRFLLGSPALAALGLFAVAALNAGAARLPLSFFPSAGPLRFGIPWLFPLAVALRSRWPRATRASWAAEGLLVGVASLWELLTFGIALVTWGGVLLAETFFASRRGPGALRGAALRIAWALLCMAAVHGGFALAVHAAAGQWPDWGLFVESVRGQTAEGEGAGLAPAPAWAGWIGLGVVYLGSLMACLAAAPRVASRGATARLVVLFAVTVMGVAQLVYWVTWSVPGRLVHVSVPASLLAAVWLGRGLQRVAPRRPGLRPALALCGLAVFTLLTAYYEPRLERWVSRSSLAAIPAVLGGDPPLPPPGCPSLGDCLTRRFPVQPASAAALALVAEHAPDAERLGLFLNGAVTTEVALLSGRLHAFPLNDAYVDSTRAASRARIVGAEHGLGPGDLIFVDRRGIRSPNPRVQDGNVLIREMLQRVCGEFRCVVVARRGSVTVERLEARE